MLSDDPDDNSNLDDDHHRHVNRYHLAVDHPKFDRDFNGHLVQDINRYDDRPPTSADLCSASRRPTDCGRFIEAGLRVPGCMAQQTIGGLHRDGTV